MFSMETTMDMGRLSQRLVAKELVRLEEGEELLSILCSLVRSWDFPATIIAGHYFLLYDAEHSRLVAVLSSAADEASFLQAEKDLIAKVGNFPVLSLITGIRVLKAFPGRSWRIAIAVDDHQFQRVQCDAPEGVRAGEIRKAYYQQQPGL